MYLYWQKCHKKPFPLVYCQSHKEKSVEGGRKTAEFPLDTLFLLDIMSEGKMAVSPFRYFPLCFIVRSGGRK